MGKRYVVTITKELEDFWGLDDLAADYDFADGEFEAFTLAAIEVVQDDVDAVLQGATWKIEAVDDDKI